MVLPQPQPTVEAASGNLPNSRDDAGWEEPKKKGRPKNKKLVIGHSESHTSFVGIAKKSVVCVSRLKSGTPTDVVSDHLKNNGINVLSCFDVSPSVENELKYTSMRVCVYTMDVNKCMMETCGHWALLFVHGNLNPKVNMCPAMVNGMLKDNIPLLLLLISISFH